MFTIERRSRVDVPNNARPSNFPKGTPRAAGREALSRRPVRRHGLTRGQKTDRESIVTC